MTRARHTLLQRQLRRHAAGVPLAGLDALLDAIDAAYHQADEDRRLLERSLELSSQELLQTGEELGAILRLLPDLFLRLTFAGEILDCQGQVAEALGVHDPEPAGRRIPDLVDPELAGELMAAVARVAGGQQRVPVAFQRSGNGAARHFEGSVFPLARGEAMIFVHDVTRRRRAEGERDRLVTAVEQAAESISITDTRGTILYINPAFTRITGYSREEALGQNPRLLKSGRHDDEFYRAMWRELTRGGVCRTRFTNRRKDGSTFELESTISPIRGERGQITNYVMVGRDVTREMELETQLRQSQKMEAVGRLAGGIAHDFNNLLTAVLGNAELALARLAPDDPTRAEMEEIKAASTRAAALTSQLLAFGRRQVLHPRVLDLNQVVRDQSTLLRRLLGEPVRMRLELEPAPWSVRADPSQIEQVIMNLAINARDAMPRGGLLTVATANVVVERDRQPPYQLPTGRYVRLTVRDTGIGMDEQVRAHLFEPFFTTKERGKGTGLGLATVYGIVKQSEGFISVESQPGAGSLFSVFLPAVAGLPAATPASASGGAAETDSGTETVLLVEDEDQVRRVARLTLEQSGYQVLEASRPSEALQQVERHPGPIALVLTDVSMPEMNGDELASRLLAVRPDLRVLFMSGHPDAARGLRRLVAGGRLFVNKPFTPADLLRKVRSTIDEAE